MRIQKIAAVITLAIASSAAHASGSNSISGVIRFTGEIVVGSCDLPTAEWSRHAGRQDGRSPVQAGAVPGSNGTCAGIADTRSVTFTPVSYQKSGAVAAGVVTISFN
ncbi:hypothetical protein [Pseudomonas sp. Q1-7]|uniref:hypothetical protein n=1 Tax=Pseudomonas sp. Q1-7 TaxID=3020843 RepID=UPI0022FFE164|nr:hypothetical protein [Pseudomonas sp. Q1-7]